MSSRGFQIEYAELAVENLGALPKTVASQIVRKVSRLEQGLHGNIRGYANRFRLSAAHG